MPSTRRISYLVRRMLKAERILVRSPFREELNPSAIGASSEFNSNPSAIGASSEFNSNPSALRASPLIRGEFSSRGYSSTLTRGEHKRGSNSFLKPRPTVTNATANGAKGSSNQIGLIRSKSSSNSRASFKKTASSRPPEENGLKTPTV